MWRTVRSGRIRLPVKGDIYLPAGSRTSDYKEVKVLIQVHESRHQQEEIQQYALRHLSVSTNDHMVNLGNGLVTLSRTRFLKVYDFDSD